MCIRDSLWNVSDFVGDSLPTQLDGVSVTLNGVAAYPYYCLLYTSPEEREKFRQGMRSRCGGFGAPTSGTNEPA